MKKIISTFKILSLAFIFAFAIHYSYWALFSNNYNENLDNGKIDLLSWLNTKKYDNIILWNIWVALTTNVWIKYKERQINNLYKNVPIIWKKISERSYSEEISRKTHMDNIKEYYNILRTDLRSLLEKSYNKKDTLEAYIAQLKYRYNLTNSNLRILKAKENEYALDLKKYSKQISEIKSKIKYDFNNFNSSNTEKNISRLLKAKADYNYANAYKIYISQYIKQYKYLNLKSKKLYDTLNNNKEAIIKDVQIVIPKSWTTNLKKLKLLINEK